MSSDAKAELERWDDLADLAESYLDEFERGPMTSARGFRNILRSASDRELRPAIAKADAVLDALWDLRDELARVSHAAHCAARDAGLAAARGDESGEGEE
jgi:hypothetical protein